MQENVGPVSNVDVVQVGPETIPEGNATSSLAANAAAPQAPRSPPRRKKAPVAVRLAAEVARTTGPARDTSEQSDAVPDAAAAPNTDKPGTSASQQTKVSPAAAKSAFAVLTSAARPSSQKVTDAGKQLTPQELGLIAAR